MLITRLAGLTVLLGGTAVLARVVIDTRTQETPGWVTPAPLEASELRSETHSGDPSEARSAARELHAALRAARASGIRSSVREWEVMVGQLLADEIPALLAAANDLPSRAQRARLTEALVRRWAQVAPEAAVSHLAGVADERVRNQLNWIAYQAWASTDPRAAAAHAASLAGDGRTGLCLRAVAETWFQTDSAAALLWLAQHDTDATYLLHPFGFREWRGGSEARTVCESVIALPAGANRDAALACAFQHLVRDDPQAALAFARRLPDPRKSSACVTAALTALAADDPDAALAEAACLPEKAQCEVWSAVVSGMAGDDPAAAFALAEGLPPGPDREQAFRSAMQAFSSQDPELAVEFALTHSSRFERLDLVAYAFHGYFAARPGEAIHWLLTQADGPERRKAMESIMWNLDDVPGLQAEPLVALARSLPEGEARIRAWAAAAGEMARGDPAAALSWACQVPDEQGRRASLSSIAGRWPISSAASAVTAAAGLRADDERREFFTTLAHNWAGEDAAMAAAQTAAIPSGADREAFLRGLLGRLRSNDPQAASALIAALPAGPVQVQETQQLVTGWTYSNPSEAGRWAANLPPGEVRDAALAAAASAMTRWDPEAALARAAQIASDCVRDDAVATVVERLAAEYPESAATWLGRISDPGRQRAAAVSIAAQWVQMDRLSAELWMTQQGIAKNELEAADEGEFVVLSPFSM